MLTHPYYGPGNVTIDSCEGCELVWLDFGELRQIVDAPGKDRGTKEMPRPVKGDAVGNPLTGARVVGSGPGTGAIDDSDLLAILTRFF